ITSRGWWSRHPSDGRGRRRGLRRQSRTEDRHGTARHAGAGRLTRRRAAFRAAADRRCPACRQRPQRGSSALRMGDAGNPARVMLVDDHAIVREGYRSLLQKQDGLRVVAEADSGAAAYLVYKEARPDLVIMDVAMPGIGGVEAIRRIRQWDKSARI